MFYFCVIDGDQHTAYYHLGEQSDNNLNDELHLGHVSSHVSRRQEREMSVPPNGGYYYNLSEETQSQNTRKKPKRSKSFKSFFSKIGKALSSVRKTKFEFDGNDIDFEEEIKEPEMQSRVPHQKNYVNCPSEAEHERRYNENNNYWQSLQGQLDEINQLTDGKQTDLDGNRHEMYPQTNPSHSHEDQECPEDGAYNHQSRGRIFSRGYSNDEGEGRLSDSPERGSYDQTGRGRIFSRCYSYDRDPNEPINIEDDRTHKHNDKTNIFKEEEEYENRWVSESHIQMTTDLPQNIGAAERHSIESESYSQRPETANYSHEREGDQRLRGRYYSESRTEMHDCSPGSVYMQNNQQLSIGGRLKREFGSQDGKGESWSKEFASQEGNVGGEPQSARGRVDKMGSPKVRIHSDRGIYYGLTDDERRKNSPREEGAAIGSSFGGIGHVEKPDEDETMKQISLVQKDVNQRNTKEDLNNKKSVDGGKDEIQKLLNDQKEIRENYKEIRSLSLEQRKSQLRHDVFDQGGSYLESTPQNSGLSRQDSAIQSVEGPVMDQCGKPHREHGGDNNGAGREESSRTMVSDTSSRGGVSTFMGGKGTVVNRYGNGSGEVDAHERRQYRGSSNRVGGDGRFDGVGNGREGANGGRADSDGEGGRENNKVSEML